MTKAQQFAAFLNFVGCYFMLQAMIYMFHITDMFYFNWENAEIVIT